MKRQRGFTLLEIMVALMIFATAAVALSNSLSEAARSTGELEKRQFADLLAQNLLIDISREGYGNRNIGETSLAGYDFVWRRTLSDTPEPSMRRVEISIQLAGEDDTLASRSAFMAKQVAK
ncbi:type II secretion system minor pseudopilin GspI [Spongiibacter sp.]|uniref:type II secretion system minor pseudopilin GspI n=1 Tax=Spongiibacter sp. TaxID=2024860 RepID=UPI0035666285